MSISDIKKSRLEKMRAFEKENINPYPLETKRNFSIKKALENFKDFSKNSKTLFLVGRIRSIRAHGGSTFINFEDGTSKIQAYFRKNEVGEKRYKFFLN